MLLYNNIIQSIFLGCNGDTFIFASIPTVFDLSFQILIKSCFDAIYVPNQ